MPVVKVECFAFWICAVIGSFQESCYYRLSNFCWAHTHTQNQLFRKLLFLQALMSKSISPKPSTKASIKAKNVKTPKSGVTRLSRDSGGKLVATAGLQDHSFSAQWIVHWRVEVRPNQNQGGNDLIFCSINTFLFGSRAMCYAAAAAIFM